MGASTSPADRTARSLSQSAGQCLTQLAHAGQHGYDAGTDDRGVRQRHLHDRAEPRHDIRKVIAVPPRGPRRRDQQEARFDEINAEDDAREEADGEASAFVAGDGIKECRRSERLAMNV